MLASLLKYDIEIYTQTTGTKNEVGERVTADTLYKRKRAGVKYLTGGEAREANQKTANVSIRFQIRYDATITEKMKIKYNGNMFDINSIEPHDELNQQYQFINASKIVK